MARADWSVTAWGLAMPEAVDADERVAKRAEPAGFSQASANQTILQAANIGVERIVSAKRVAFQGLANISKLARPWITRELSVLSGTELLVVHPLVPLVMGLCHHGPPKTPRLR
jgi:hypothetical protein